MSKVCHGHPNLPLFIGLYEHQAGLPKLVSKLYTVNGESVTLHMLLSGKLHLQFTTQQWARILTGLCNAVEAVHSHGFLHNDIKADNVVLSDSVPDYGNSPPLVPVLIDFGKSRPVTKPKTYKLAEKEKEYYRIHHKHIAPEVINVTHPQSIKSDVFSLGRITYKAGEVTSSSLQSIGHKCMFVNPACRPLPIGLYAQLSKFV